jgi:nitronate monooxygenase
MAFDRRFLDLVGVEHPIIQAPMIGPKRTLTASVSEAGGLGSLGCAAMSPDVVRAEVEAIRAATAKPINLNFFCHQPAPPDEARERGWRATLAPFYGELGLDPDASVRAPCAPPSARLCARS